MKIFKAFLPFILLPALLLAQPVKIVTNQVGYETGKAKKAIIVADAKMNISQFQLVDANTGSQLLAGKPVYSGPVDKWKHFVFWTIDFSNYTSPGKYKLQAATPGGIIYSYPFTIGDAVLEKATVSDVIYYFKGQRSSGLFDKADHHLALAGSDADTVDAHGGWYDATGDYGKHLSHLSFSNYFNPQQISFTDWSLFKTYELLSHRAGTDFRQIDRRILDEAMYGADYLARMHAKGGSFYRSVGAPGPGKLPQDRRIQPDEGNYRIKVTKDQSFTGKPEVKSWRSYQASYRSGGGVAIAALALASSYPVSGDYSNADYLAAAEDAFAFLEKENPKMDYDGKENILDDYCALMAAAELFRVTHKDVYQKAAEKRAGSLVNRLTGWKSYQNYWRADGKDRPFFHAADAGLPVVSLLNYYPLASHELQAKIKNTVKLSMEFELTVTAEVNNPFGYSRQLVQDTLGNRRTSFFFPHGSDAAPWWQGDDARIASMATAARMAAELFKDARPA